MGIPDYQTVMLPLLKLAGDGQEHIMSEAYDVLAAEFGLTADERKELLPSGRQPTFENRVGWARTHMAKAGLLTSPSRGRFCITGRGEAVLSEAPNAIGTKLLSRFPEYQQFTRATQPSSPSIILSAVPEPTTAELLETSYQSLRLALAEELLERVRNCSPRFFEQLVVDLLVGMGYGGSRKDAGQAVGKSGDGGIDGIIKEDKLGLDVVYIQAKRWSASRTVGSPDVMGFAGSLAGQKAQKGVYITTSQFSRDAHDYVNKINAKIVLIDGKQLAQLMIEHGIGVSEEQTYTVKRVDLDYFEG